MKLVNPLLFSKAMYHFYVAGYYESFTQAADYLCIGQSAVSHAIKELESAIGTPLFNRQYRQVRLTENGQLLFQSLQISQIPVEKILEDIYYNQQLEHRVTLSISMATAIHLILPNITSFKQCYPQVEIRCITHDIDPDLSKENIDLAIPLGISPWQAYQQWHLTPEIIFPVASPEFIANLTQTAHNQYEISQLPLIHLDEKKKTRFDWRDWFNHFDKSILLQHAELSCNDYSIALQMAMDGQGVCLGWQHLVTPLIEQGKLVRISNESIRSKHNFTLITQHNNPLPHYVQLLKDWLVDEVFYASRYKRYSGTSDDNQSNTTQ